MLAFAVDAAGFLYDPRQDIIYSKMYPLQRHFGYAYGYDAAALAMNAIIDCEPIFFDYGGKTWMIELWKGQYGLETGCEIGVYNRASGAPFPYSILDATVGKRPNDPNPSHNLFFDCASDSELLTMSSTLYRNGEKLFCRGPERHWWLTGFKWGVLSEPSDLTMDVSITCLDEVMTSALVGASDGHRLPERADQRQHRELHVRHATHAPAPRRHPAARLGRARREPADRRRVRQPRTHQQRPEHRRRPAAAATERSFAIYAEQFFASAIANLARIFGIDLASAVRTLTDAFQVALDAASQFVTDAGYTLASWINGLENIVSQALDFSCVVEINNRSPYELVRDAYGITKGNWSIAPPERIPAGGVGRFWLRDPKPTLDGSEGWANYSWVDSSGRRQSSEFVFADPTGTSPNLALSTNAFSFYTKSSDINFAWAARNFVVTGGHPFFVAFVWGTGPAP